MKFPSTIQKGILIQRYKRFLADIDLDGTVITAHCANPGSMMGLKEPGSTVWVSKALNPNRKLGYDFQVIEVDDVPVCINTALPNKIIEEAIAARQIDELAGYAHMRREVKYGANSRIDLLLEDENRAPCYVEVKNVTLSRTRGLAEFPDSPTARGLKHLHELEGMVKSGARTVMLYLVNRGDCTDFTIARDIDPGYAESFDKVRKTGVEILAYDCQISDSGITLGCRLGIFDAECV